MIKKLLYIVALIVLAVTIYSLNSGGPDKAYRQKVANVRAERIRYLKNAKESPFQQFEIKYQPLEFFPINESFKVRANLERIANPQRVMIPSSDDSSEPYIKFAYATFKLNGQPLKLLILKPAGFGALPNVYFTAFADDTSGESTYGGGRYLDLEIGKSDNIEIDFNLAYNPYCAYAKEYSCPLPPAENILPIAITAGEKDFPH